MVDPLLVGNEVCSFARELVHYDSEEGFLGVELFPREALVGGLPNSAVGKLDKDGTGILEVVVRRNQRLEVMLDVS